MMAATCQAYHGCCTAKVNEALHYTAAVVVSHWGIGDREGVINGAVRHLLK